MSQVVVSHEKPELSYTKYSIGFLVSVILTVAAYVQARYAHYSVTEKELLLAGLAILQFFVQMFLFLHIGKQRARLVMAGLMLAIVLILVGGTLWVMHSLNYRMMMTPQQMDEYMRDQDSL